MAYASEEAAGLGDPLLTPEHILLGLLSGPEQKSVKVLEALGIQYEDLRREIFSRRTLGEGAPPHEPPVGSTRAAQRVLTFALQEAQRLGHPVLGSAHLLLGTLREPDASVEDVFKSFGMNLELTAQAVARLLGGVRLKEAPPLTRSVRPRTLTPAAQSLHIRQSRYASDRLALMILAEGSVSDLLLNSNVRPGSVQASLEELVASPPTKEDLQMPSKLDGLLGQAQAISGGQPMDWRHVFIAIAQDDTTFLHWVLNDLGVDISAWPKAMMQ